MSSSGASTRWGIGVALVVAGVLLLLHTTGIADLGGYAKWIPSLFILLGLVLIVANRFRRIAWPVIMIVIAAIIQLSVLDIDATIFWPVALIAVGAVILFGIGRRRRRGSGTDSADVSVVVEDGASTVMGSSDLRLSASDLNDTDFSTVMGESKLDLRDIDRSALPAELSVTCVMGEVKIRVPSEWTVKIANSTVMGESKDERRSAPTAADPDLTITGSVVMGSLKVED